MICKRWICHSCVDFLAASSCTNRVMAWMNKASYSRVWLTMINSQMAPSYYLLSNLDNPGGSFLSNWLPSAHWLSSSGSMLLPTNIDAASTHSIFRSQQQWQARDPWPTMPASWRSYWSTRCNSMAVGKYLRWCRLQGLVGQLKDLTPLRWKHGVMSSVIETWSNHEGDRLKVCNTPRTTKILE